MAKPNLEEMDAVMHPGVKSVAEFMCQNLPADQLVGVANAIQMLAEPLWGQYPKVAVQPMQLEAKPILMGLQ